MCSHLYYYSLNLYFPTYSFKALISEAGCCMHTKQHLTLAGAVAPKPSHPVGAFLWLQQQVMTDLQLPSQPHHPRPSREDSPLQKLPLQELWVGVAEIDKEWHCPRQQQTEARSFKSEGPGGIWTYKVQDAPCRLASLGPSAPTLVGQAHWNRVPGWS